MSRDRIRTTNKRPPLVRVASRRQDMGTIVGWLAAAVLAAALTLSLSSSIAFGADGSAQWSKSWHSWQVVHHFVHKYGSVLPDFCDYEPTS
jgi:hypothetical protein